VGVSLAPSWSGPRAPGPRSARPADSGSSPSSRCGRAPGRCSASLSRRDIPWSRRPVPLPRAWPGDPAQLGALAHVVGCHGRIGLSITSARSCFPGPGTTQPRNRHRRALGVRAPRPLSVQQKRTRAGSRRMPRTRKPPNSRRLACASRREHARETPQNVHGKEGSPVRVRQRA
jgi:hypothetical protein